MAVCATWCCSAGSSRASRHHPGPDPRSRRRHDAGREAIRRLIAEGALTLLGNRRVVVPQLTPGLLDQVAFARLTIEPRLAELACARLTPDLITRLEAIDFLDQPRDPHGRYPRLSLGQSQLPFRALRRLRCPVLEDMARSLWLRFGPSLRVVCARVGTGNLPDLHDEALAAMRAGDALRLSRAIERDIAQGVDQVREALSAATFDQILALGVI